MKVKALKDFTAVQNNKRTLVMRKSVVNLEDNNYTKMLIEKGYAEVIGKSDSKDPIKLAEKLDNDLSDKIIKKHKKEKKFDSKSE
jgi:hypothetical protein